MEIRRFDMERDLTRLENFLRDQYRANHNMTSWLPQRLNDLIFRIDVQHLQKHGVLLRCREKGIEKCYVNSYSWRRKFYNAAGFRTEDCIGLWTKTL